MLIKQSSLTALMLFIGWVAVQSAALHHEFSAEHLLSNGSHLCHAQIGNVEDFDIPPAAPQVLPQAKEMLFELNAWLPLIIESRIKSHLARAPPQMA